MGGSAESMLYSLVNIDVNTAPAAATPAAAPAADRVGVAGGVAAGAGVVDIAAFAGDMAGMGGAAELVGMGAGLLGMGAGLAGSGAAKDAEVKGEPQTKDEVKGEPQKTRPTYELRGKDGTVAWSFKLVDLTGTLDVKTLKGEKAVCAVLTAPGRSAYKLVKLKSDVYKLAVYKAATAEADVSASDLVFDLNSNMMEDTWSLTAAPGGELVATFVKPSSMQEETAPREATFGEGADLELCLAILSAMQAWPVLETGAGKKELISYGELIGIATEEAL